MSTLNNKCLLPECEARAVGYRYCAHHTANPPRLVGVCYTSLQASQERPHTVFDCYDPFEGITESEFFGGDIGDK